VGPIERDSWPGDKLLEGYADLHFEDISNCIFYESEKDKTLFRQRETGVGTASARMPITA
jgi:uncharacterized protein (DUF433 family)